MRVLVLHSDIGSDPPPDELDTLIAAEAVRHALVRQGHCATLAAFAVDQDRLEQLLELEQADVVFNLVEGIGGLGQHAPIAPRMLDDCGAPFTGATAGAMALTNDKPLTKRKLRAAGIATPDWSEPDTWKGLKETTYIVKSALEDASFCLDDFSVVSGKKQVKVHTADCYLKHGGRWFAEEFIDGREFNISMLEGPHGLHVLPMAEMVFESWPEHRPRIVGYTAKWSERSLEAIRTVRRFGVESEEPKLAAKMRQACVQSWELFELTGYARVDFRVTPEGEPLVLEINTNPGIAPDAGFAAAAARAGMSYDEMVVRIIDAARLRSPALSRQVAPVRSG